MFDKIALEQQLVGKGMNYSKLASYLGISRERLRRKILHNGNFSREEIEKMRTLFGTDESESFLFPNKVA